MVKLIYCLNRRSGLSVEEFQSYWREVHGPIAAKIPGLRRYVQSHVLPSTYASTFVPPYDGVAELWFDDLESFQRAVASAEMMAAREDERNFIDHGRIAILLSEEKVIVG